MTVCVRACAPQVAKGRSFVSEVGVKFGRGEEYCVELARSDPNFSVERYSGRLKSLKFKSTYTEDVEYLKTNVDIVTSSCNEVLDSRNLREFLVDIILSFGPCVCVCVCVCG